MQPRGEATQLLPFLSSVSFQASVHGKALRVSTRQISLTTGEEGQISLVVSIFHIKMSGETEEKEDLFPLRRHNWLDCFSVASSRPLTCSRFHICLHYPDCWGLPDPVLPSGYSSDLNGTGQGYIQSVCSRLYAMMRWLLRSLMSAGGTRSFFTGVGSRVERLPLGLNKSDTQKTCGRERTNIN